MSVRLLIIFHEIGGSPLVTDNKQQIDFYVGGKPASCKQGQPGRAGLNPFSFDST